jgi:hypothetical protein
LLDGRKTAWPRAIQREGRLRIPGVVEVAGEPLAQRLVEEKAELILGAYMTAIQQGDWRASASLLERVYGRPRERVEVGMPDSPEAVEELSLAQIREIRSRFELVSDESS